MPNQTRKFSCWPSEAERGTLEAKLDAIGWGLFFVWVGVAWISQFGLGVGLFGVGTITLGMQVVRKFNRLPVEGFWIVVGTLFLLGGLWDSINITVPFAPLLLIALGLAVLARHFLPSR